MADAHIIRTNISKLPTITPTVTPIVRADDSKIIINKIYNIINDREFNFIKIESNFFLFQESLFIFPNNFNKTIGG